MKDKISKTKLEHYEQIAHDTRKIFYYDHHSGEWGWADKDDEDDAEAFTYGFATRLDALVDAIDPYINNEEE